MPWISLCSLEELTEGCGKYVEIEGFGLAVFLTNGVAHTLDNTCPHAGAPMTDGYIDGACNVVCPVHQLKFNLRNGRDSNGEGYRLKTYPVEIRPDGIYIGLDEGGLFKWF